MKSGGVQAMWEEVTDGELLARFATNRDGAPFEELARRHGALVYNVCRRILGTHEAAEDASQAVFLTLARKASSLGGLRSAAAWLHRVAWHIALRLRESERRRGAREKEAARMHAPESGEAPEAREEARALRGILDQELAALPEAYRLPLLLHHLEGLGEAETARRLGLNAGTLSSRLARGRERLRERLASRGVVLSAGALVPLLAREAQAHALPEGFAALSAKAAVWAATGELLAGSSVPVSARAVELTQGALHAMSFVTLKLAALVLLAVTLAASAGGWYAFRAGAAEEPAPRRGDPEPAPAPPPAAPQRFEETRAAPAGAVLRVKGLHAEGMGGRSWWSVEVLESYKNVTGKEPGKQLTITGKLPWLTEGLVATVYLRVAGAGEFGADEGHWTYADAEGWSHLEFPPPPAQPSKRHGLEVTLKPAQAVFAPGAPLRFEVGFKNASEGEIRVHGDGNVLAAEDERAQVVDLRSGAAAGFALAAPAKPSQAEHALAPGAAWSRTIELDAKSGSGPLQPGRYWLAAEVGQRVMKLAPEQQRQTLAVFAAFEVGER
ncbi:MAG: sigma-70 family RNA polymerase sigma factor [Planctomycetota bacterium]|nr:sigma-70 family RNA polymerase sigma factor [Planctomycetota bacterium]